jgi:hypothetical protein
MLTLRYLLFYYNFSLMSSFCLFNSDLESKIIELWCCIACSLVFFFFFLLIDLLLEVFTDLVVSDFCNEII